MLLEAVIVGTCQGGGGNKNKIVKALGGGGGWRRLPLGQTAWWKTLGFGIPVLKDRRILLFWLDERHDTQTNVDGPLLHFLCMC
jgi:hypothetical protein